MAKKKETNEGLIFNLEGICLEKYMQSQYKDVLFRMNYLSRIIKYVLPKIEKLKTQKEFYDDIIKNSLHPELIFHSDTDFEYDSHDFGEFTEDITELSNKALDSIAEIGDTWRKENLCEDYYNEKRPKISVANN